MNIYFMIAACAALIAAILYFYEYKSIQQTLGAQPAIVLGACTMQGNFMLLAAMVFTICAFEQMQYMYAFSITLFIALYFSLFAIWRIFAASEQSKHDHQGYWHYIWGLYFSISIVSLCGLLQ